MTVLDYTITALGVAATLFSIVLVVSVVVGYTLIIRLHRIMDRIEAMSQTGLEASTLLRSFVEKSAIQLTALVEMFFTVKGARIFLREVSKVFNSNDQNQSKSRREKAYAHT